MSFGSDENSESLERSDYNAAGDLYQLNSIPSHNKCSLAMQPIYKAISVHLPGSYPEMDNPS